MVSVAKNVLSLSNVTMQFGGLKAVNNLSFDVKENEILGIIGPNGAGKTTLFNCITQFYDNYDGSISYTDRDDNTIDLRSIAVTNVINLGIARTFQNIELIPDLSVIDNVLVGAHKQFHSTLIEQILKLPRARKEEKQLRAKALEILEFLNIAHLKDFYVAGQPYGILKKIEIARTLMSNPRLIILDEPAAGLNDSETDELETIIYEIKARYGASIMVIEHDMGFVMNICDRVCAINFGQLLAIDTPKKIQQNKLVQEAYLGKEDQ